MNVNNNVDLSGFPMPEGIPHPERLSEAWTLLANLCPQHQLAVTSALTGFFAQRAPEDTWHEAMMMAETLMEHLR